MPLKFYESIDSATNFLKGLALHHSRYYILILMIFFIQLF